MSTRQNTVMAAMNHTRAAYEGPVNSTRTITYTAYPERPMREKGARKRMRCRSASGEPKARREQEKR